jgi:hypothetical protein
VPFNVTGSVPINPADRSVSVEQKGGELDGSYIRGTVDSVGNANGTLRISDIFDYQGTHYECLTITDWTTRIQR